MIIDADCHISPILEGGNSIKIDELLRRMDKASVDKALTWLQPPYLREIDESNRYIYEMDFMVVNSMEHKIIFILMIQGFLFPL
jgi:hypothetical protein